MQLVLCNAALDRKQDHSGTQAYMGPHTHMECKMKGLTQRSNACSGTYADVSGEQLRWHYIFQITLGVYIWSALSHVSASILQFIILKYTTAEGKVHARYMTGLSMHSCAKGGWGERVAGETERERQYLYQHVISSWVVNAWNYRMSIVLVNSLIFWIFHWGQLLACLLINLIAAARMSCSSVSWRELEFVQAAESRAAPTLLVGLLQGNASNLDWIIMIAWRMLSCSS